MAITLLRHTRPDVAEGICYGQLDVDVAASFEVDAKAALDGLPLMPELIVSSPLQRCKKLAHFITAACGAVIQIDPRLMEIDFGTWEGAAWNEIDRAQIDEWADDFAFGRPHKGESVAQLKARVDDALCDLTQSSQSLLVVTHAGVIRAAMAPDLEAASFERRIAFGQAVTMPGHRS